MLKQLHSFDRSSRLPRLRPELLLLRRARS
jgi:hypothetical protein